MAAESLVGGLGEDILNQPQVKQILDPILAGSTPGSIQIEISTAPDGTRIIQIHGANPNTPITSPHPIPELNTLIIIEPPGQSQLTAQQLVEVTVDNGAAHIQLALPTDFAVGMKGLQEAASLANVEQYLHSLLEQALPKASPDPAVQALRSSIEQSVNTALNVLKAAGVEQAVVQVIDVGASQQAQAQVTQLGSAQNAHAEIQLTGSTEQTEHFVLLAGNVADQGIIKVSNVEAISVLGQGQVQTETAATVIGDLSAQRIEGSLGNDTLIGGGGNDTLVGGGGHDVFGFNALGHYTIEGAGKDDSFAFLFPGIEKVEQLAQYLTGVVETAQGVTFEFGPNASITLVGLKASDITADMIHFNL